MTKKSSYPEASDAANEALLADPAAFADGLTDNAAQASMTPVGLIGDEVATYFRAAELAAPFLAEWAMPTLQFPVAAGATNLGGPETLASRHQKAHGGSARNAIESAVRKLSGWVHDADEFGTPRQLVARITASIEPNDLESTRLFLVDLPAPTSQGHTAAIISLVPSRTYSFVSRDTGELVTVVDTGKVRPSDRGRRIPQQVAVWAGYGGIARLLTADQAEGVALDWTWDGETENVAWALSTLRSLSKLQARRLAAGDLSADLRSGRRSEDESFDVYDEPF